MSPETVVAFAQSLIEAERTRMQIGLISLAAPQATMDDAYAIQAALVARKVAAGGKIIGWKIGLTSKAMQSALNIDIPDSGVLFEDMLFPDGGTVPPRRFIQPRIEAEIAFLMRAPLDKPDATIDDVFAATAHVAPSFEILDTRILRVDSATGKARGIVDTIADNAANAGLVLGPQQKPAAFDLRRVGAIVTRNGEVEETGLGAGVLNHPALAVAWLSRRLATYGLKIAAGDVVLAGSFIRPIEARPGDVFAADFGDFGAITIGFG